MGKITLLVEVPWQFKQWDSARIMDSISNYVMAALRRMAEHSHIYLGEKSKLPYCVRHLEGIDRGPESGKLVSVRHVRGGPTPRGRRGLHGGQSMQRTYAD